MQGDMPERMSEDTVDGHNPTPLQEQTHVYLCAPSLTLETPRFGTCEINLVLERAASIM